MTLANLTIFCLGLLAGVGILSRGVCCQRGPATEMGAGLRAALTALCIAVAGVIIFGYVWLAMAMGEEPLHFFFVTVPRALYSLIGRWIVTMSLLGELVG
jgi:hypothetical protein